MNNENGMVYIGATTGSIDHRIKDHFQKASCRTGHKLHEAIWTFGPEAFSWEQIDTASNLNELAEKERQYIEKYNSKAQGYNGDSGGGFKKAIYQYSLDGGILLATYNSLESASSAISATNKQLSRACLNVSHELEGFYWSYTYKEPFEPEKDQRNKCVLQLDDEWNIVGEFKSISEAFKQTGINKSSIAKVCRGERNHAGGFHWKYK